MSTARSLPTRLSMNGQRVARSANVPSRKPGALDGDTRFLRHERVELVLPAVVPPERAEFVVGAVTGMTHELGTRHAERREPLDGAA